MLSFNWPPKSYDLSPLDLKEKSTQTIPQLKENFRSTIGEIGPNLCENARENIIFN